MDWGRIGYALACVVAPLAWGLIIVWVSNRMDRDLLRKGGGRRGGKRRAPRPIEYHI